MLENYFDFSQFWEDIREINKGNLEDFETDLNDITLCKAEMFLNNPWLELDIDECGIDGTDVCLCFVSESYDTQGFAIWMRVSTKDDGAITWIRSDQW
jgi:hypothetical protein